MLVFVIHKLYIIWSIRNSGLLFYHVKFRFDHIIVQFSRSSEHASRVLHGFDRGATVGGQGFSLEPYGHLGLDIAYFVNAYLVSKR